VAVGARSHPSAQLTRFLCRGVSSQVNILEDDAIRQGMKEYSAWPTFPQVYIGGEFYGGADILIGA
jgi:glutaredoxin-related protein